MKPCYEIFGRTETGPLRQSNEDHILLGRFIKNAGGLGLWVTGDDDYVSTYGLLCAVADGVGGSQGGAVASRLALSAFDTQFYGVEKSGANSRMDACAEALHAAGERANRSILACAPAKPELAGMACTVTGLCLTPEGCLVFHAGDSRAYRFRGGFLKSLTNDDSVTNMAVRSGALSLEDAERHAARHTITNCLGSTSFSLRVEKGPELRDHDVLLICTDGLHDSVSLEDIEGIITVNLSAESIVDALVEEAIRCGGPDNISVVVICLNPAENETPKASGKDGGDG